MIKKIVQQFYENIYLWAYPSYPKELKRSVKGCKTLLDIGCGSNSPVRFFSKQIDCTGIDAFMPSIEKSKKKRIHKKYFLMNIFDIKKKIPPRSYDCVLASDVIEHLSKENGIKLIRIMENIAKKKVILFTPNGFLKQGKLYNNPWQIHKSGWSIEEMRQQGYDIIGINGLKALRKPFSEKNGSFKFKPKIFWMLVSDLTQFFTKKHPKYAFHILCVSRMSPRQKKLSQVLEVQKVVIGG